ncbi:hypothetical protein V1291_001503 [Nitrobacteraceae bacterium AZCC 1564]
MNRHRAGGSFRAILAWLDRDTLLKRIETEIDMLPQPLLALSEEDKASRLQEVQAALFKLELQEEAAIGMALESGIELARRPDADPAAILGSVVGKAAARAAA